MIRLLVLCILTSISANIAIGQITLSSSGATLGKSAQCKLTVYENTKAGKTAVTYSITNSKLHIYQKPFGNQNYQEHLHTVHQLKSKALLNEIRKLNLDQLNEVYTNTCIEPDTGNAYHILLANGSKPISIKLYHYYVHEVELLVKLLNGYVPQSLQIKYLTNNNKQNCGT